MGDMLGYYLVLQPNTPSLFWLSHMVVLSFFSPFPVTIMFLGVLVYLESLETKMQCHTTIGAF